MTKASSPRPGETICVIGGGFIGLFTALKLQEAGKKVILLERGKIGGRQAASFGNGCWINPGAIMPMSVPGLWRDVPKYLLDKNGPFTIHLSHLPRLIGWLLRFLWAGRNWAKVEHQIEERLALLNDPVAAYRRFAVSAGVEHLINTSGTMYIYRDQQELDNDRRGWLYRQKHKIRTRYIGKEELYRLEPSLEPGFGCAMLIEDAATLTDPSAFCSAMSKLLIERGGLVLEDEAIGFVLHGGKLNAVKTATKTLSCTQAVICAGAWSKTLAAQLGDSVSLISERGYHISIPKPAVTVNHGLMHAEGKMAMVSTSSGLRVAGQVELASIDEPANWKRAEILFEYAKRTFPILQGSLVTQHHDRWLGHRPSTPDSLPVIDVSKASRDIVYAFGHGHTGVSMAPRTASMVVYLLGHDDQPENKPSKAFSAQRF